MIRQFLVNLVRMQILSSLGNLISVAGESVALVGVFILPPSRAPEEFAT
jgi:hypothetical protein